MAEEAIELFSIHTLEQIEALNHSIRLIIEGRQYIAADGTQQWFQYSSNVYIRNNDA